jgi:hypothetical protein
LVVSDLHLPFEHQKSLNFCKAVRKEFKCGKVVFIGDLVDNHYSSFHQTCPDGYGGKKELSEVINRLKPWYRAFPEATITLGSHDLRVMRQAYKNNIPSQWIKGFGEVLGVPNWNFEMECFINGVRFLHGDSCSSTIQSLFRSDSSIVFGHWHSKFEIVYAGNKFGMCVASLIDQENYAFDYAKTYLKKSILGCGVVLNHGKLPLLIPLN